MLNVKTQELWAGRVDALCGTIGNYDAWGDLMESWDPEFKNSSFRDAFWYGWRVGALAQPDWWLGLKPEEKYRRIDEAHDEYLAAA